MEGNKNKIIKRNYYKTSNTMKAEDFTDMITGAYRVGFMEAMRAYEPSRDLIRANEVKSWLKMMHISQKKFEYLCDNEMIKTVRKGTGNNSPIYYSKSEIIRVLFTSRANFLHEMEKMRESILNNPA